MNEPEREPAARARLLLREARKDGARERGNENGRCAALRFHRGLEGYTPTPVAELETLARRLGVADVRAKLEIERFSLPAFKILGASWAAHRALCERFGVPADAPRLELRRAARGTMLVAATDGNHGRAVARVARDLKLRSTIFVPVGTVAARIDRIAEEGARVLVVAGDYGRAVAAATEEARRGALLIQDTAFPGYETVPRWIEEGYATMFFELDEQLGAPPGLVLVQIGVGSFAAAALRHHAGNGRPRAVGVEPLDAACALESLRASGPVVTAGPHTSIMAGLNCDAVSTLALPVLADGLDACLAIPDARCEEAVEVLADAGHAVGESGAAGLAGLIELLEGDGSESARVHLGISRDTRVLLYCTEGITDPEGHAARASVCR